MLKNSEIFQVLKSEKNTIVYVAKKGWLNNMIWCSEMKRLDQTLGKKKSCFWFRPRIRKRWCKRRVYFADGNGKANDRRLQNDDESSEDEVSEICTIPAVKEKKVKQSQITDFFRTDK